MVIGSFAPRPKASQKVETPKQELSSGKKPSPVATPAVEKKKSDPQPSQEQVVIAPAEAPALVWYKDPKWIISILITLLLLLIALPLILKFRKKIRRAEYGEERVEEVAETSEESADEEWHFWSPGTWHPDVQRVGHSFLALVVINAVLYGLTINRVPEVWNWYAEYGIFFLAFNGGILAAIYFYYQKDTEGKYTPDMRQRAKLILWTIGILVTTNLVVWGFKSSKTGSDGGTADQVHKIPIGFSKGHMYDPENLPAEVALKVIGSCESLGHPNGEPVHYEKDENGDFKVDESGGKILLRNRADGKARGKYQIMPFHWDEAKKLNPPLNLDIEKDYDAYALYLYNTTGTQHWEFDADKGQGPACWGPKFLALGYKPNSEIERVMVVEAPISDFGRPISLIYGSSPYGYFTFESREGAFMVRDQKGAIAHYYPDKGGEHLPYPSTTLEFHSLENKPVKVTLTLGNIPLVRN